MSISPGSGTSNTTPAVANGKPRIVATYDYRDEHGKLLFQSVRREPGADGAKKDFRQRQPGANGGWSWTLKGVRLVPYRLPELLSAHPEQLAFVAEGEKDVENLRGIGCVATTNAMGAGQWKVEYGEHLRGRHVIILPDNDKAGRNHAADVATKLAGLAKSVLIVELPDLPPKGDVSDWLAVPGNDKVKLLELAQAAQREQQMSSVHQHPKPQTSKTPGKNRVSGFGTPHDKPAKCEPRILPAYQPFPVEALPEPIGEYVRQAKVALGCDCAYLALPILAVAASLIGNTRVIRLKGGWTEPSVIWSAIVGYSGSLKSPAFRKALGPVYRMQKRLRNEHKLAMAKFLESKQSHKGNDDGTPAPVEPVFRRVLVSDSTIEKQADILQENPKGLLYGRDELSAWFNSFQRYKGKAGGSDLPHWLEFWQAGTVQIDRKMGPKPYYFVENGAVFITGSIQPGVLSRALSPEAIDAGLAARFLMAMPPRLPKKWTELEVAPETEQAYSEILDKLQQLYFGRDNEGGEAPHVLRLSPEAKEAWVAHYDSWAQEQANVDGALAASFSKLEAYTARLALLHHVVTYLARGDDDRQSVGVECIQAGVTLCHWFAGEARRIYATLGESDEERDARQLVEFIQSRGGKISVQELRRSNNKKYPNTEMAEVTLSELVAAGLGPIPFMLL